MRENRYFVVPVNGLRTPRFLVLHDTLPCVLISPSLFRSNSQFSITLHNWKTHHWLKQRYSDATLSVPCALSKVD